MKTNWKSFKSSLNHAGGRWSDGGSVTAPPRVRQKESSGTLNKLEYRKSITTVEPGALKGAGWERKGFTRREGKAGNSCFQSNFKLYLSMTPNSSQHFHIFLVKSDCVLLVSVFKGQT